MTLRAKLKKYLFMSEKQAIEEYLSEATNLAELERKQRLLDRKPNLFMW